MFSREQSTIRSGKLIKSTFHSQIFWLKIQFRIIWKLKWSVQNILPPEERNTEKWAGFSSPKSFKRDEEEEYENGNYPSRRVKFVGSRFLASSDHLLPLLHVNEKAEAQLTCLACITVITFYFLHFSRGTFPHRDCLAPLRSVCLKNAKK